MIGPRKDQDSRWESTGLMSRFMCSAGSISIKAAIFFFMLFLHLSTSIEALPARGTQRQAVLSLEFHAATQKIQPLPYIPGFGILFK